MAIIDNNISYTEYLDGYRIGDDSKKWGNAIKGTLNLDLVIPATINGKSVIRIGNASFYNAKIKSLTLPDTLREIGAYSIDSCYLELDELVLPEALTRVEFYGFSSNSIKQYVIGENVEYIGAGAFSHNLELESIVVSQNNDHFVSVNGVLYNKDMTILYCLPYLVRNYKIPFTITKLMHRSICQKYATTLWIPSSISSIDDQVFFLITNVRTIHFLGNIDSISAKAFTSLDTELQSIVYHGAKVYSEAITFQYKDDIKVYVCNEYPGDNFAGKKVIRFGSCYIPYRTCKNQRRYDSHKSITLFN